jgi:hypothetical protein
LEQVSRIMRNVHASAMVKKLIRTPLLLDREHADG